MEYMGRDGFIWWHGVVEDINDPLELGRCRVRIFGYHSSDRNEVPIESLPWAHPMQSINSAAISGIGNSPTGLLNGSHVFGFFRDASDAQQPCILGSFGGIPQQEADINSGFNDPDGEYPKLIKEQDTNRLARGVTEGTIVESKIQAMEGHKKHPTANGAGDNGWEEPMVPYAAKYPHNNVYESKSGHIQEFDDTEGAERIHTYHRSGTFDEVHPDGSRVLKIVGDDYELILKNKNIHISGNANVLVNGQSTFYVQGDSDIQVDKDANITVGGDVNAVVDGNVKAEAKKNVNVTAQEVLALKGAQAVALYSGGGVFIQDMDEGTFDMRSTDGNVDWTMKGDLNINATGNVTIRGKNIDLNP